MGKCIDSTMDEAMRKIVEAMFDFDNNEATLQIILNEGTDIEALVDIQLCMTHINGDPLIKNEESS
jgi:hypothetical protein